MNDSADTTAITNAYADVAQNATIQNSMQAITGMGIALVGGIVLALVMTLVKRISKRVSRGKSGL